ncbi:sensor histidine kinase [Thermodesulfobacteriota bacterium]
METCFAPAMRTDRRKLKNQIGTISNSLVMSSLLKAVNGLLVVLNEDRQIVALNHAFLDSLGILDPEEALGLRLGESLHCIHSAEPPNGCGTTPYCVTCGATIAMMTAIDTDSEDEQVCALTAEQGGVIEDICLLIKSKPLKVDENRWILLYAQDITQQQFWATLERVFFHDMNNILNAIVGYSGLLALEFPQRMEVQQITNAATRLASEITLQRSLSQRKDLQYLARKEETSLKQIQQDVDLIVKGHSAAKNKNLKEVWPTKDRIFLTDSMLVSRILGNMVINALEATEENGTVQLITQLETAHVTWNVWNNRFISSDVQRRIFQRNFSTKSGRGRGLGTYSMKLFGEDYLGGEVTFVSTEHEGTTFTFRLPLS